MSPLCFHYNQVGHKEVVFLEMIRGVVRAPAPATLRIADGREGRVEDLVVRSQEFQTHVEGIRVPSVDVARA